MGSNIVINRDEVDPNIICIRQILPDGRPHVGTGFFVAGAANRLYLVTAGHVMAPLEDDAEFIISELGTSRPIHVGWSELVQSSRRPLWKTHHEADIAVLPLTVTKDFFDSVLGVRFLPIPIFPSDEVSPNKEDLLSLFGYPGGLGSYNRVSPLTLDSRAASRLVTLPRFDTGTPCTFFLMQDAAMGGYSGGPVFEFPIRNINGMTISSGRGTECWGIVHGTISDGRGGALAAITPSYYLRSLIPD